MLFFRKQKENSDMRPGLRHFVCLLKNVGADNDRQMSLSKVLIREDHFGRKRDARKVKRESKKLLQLVKNEEIQKSR